MRLCGESTHTKLDKILGDQGVNPKDICIKLVRCLASPDSTNDAVDGSVDMILKVILADAKDAEEIAPINAALGVENYRINALYTDALKEHIHNSNSCIHNAKMSGYLAIPVIGLLATVDFLTDFASHVPVIGRGVLTELTTLFTSAYSVKDLAQSRFENKEAHKAANNIWEQMKSNASSTV